MAGRKKDSKGKARGTDGGGRKGKKDPKVVDEYKLRRDLRRKERSTEPSGVDFKLPQEDIMRCAEDLRIGGIEGGGTHSTLVVLDGQGKKLTEVKGPDTNHWILGMDETVARISAMIEKAKVNLGMSETTPMHCVGLSLSGCEEETTNRKLVKNLHEKFPHSSKSYVVSSDTLGSLRTALQNGGIVLIAGTGSNALLINPDGKTHGCGGWGYMIGDEGSAYWIAHRACKYVFDDMDNFAKAPHSISYVWPAMRNYFGVSDRNAILTHFYTNFDKSNIAMFTKEIVIGCEREDPLCLFLFEEAGRLLARHIVSLSQKVHNDLMLEQGGLKIICVGSVWKSWKYMEKGFLQEIHKERGIDELSLLRLTTSSALGACYLAAEKIEVPFVKPYHQNAEIFHHYRRKTYIEADKQMISRMNNLTLTCGQCQR